jgi:hypothetical protein
LCRHRTAPRRPAFGQPSEYGLPLASAVTIPVMPLWLVPLIVIGALVVLFGLVALLGRIQNGRYLRPIVAGLVRAPLIGRWFQKLTRAALEKQNPELASAIRKLERAGADRDPQRAQRAMSQLTAAERRAYLDAAGEHDSMPEPANRQQRRAMERQRRR